MPAVYVLFQTNFSLRLSDFLSSSLIFYRSSSFASRSSVSIFIFLTAARIIAIFCHYNKFYASILSFSRSSFAIRSSKSWLPPVTDRFRGFPGVPACWSPRFASRSSPFSDSCLDENRSRSRLLNLKLSAGVHRELCYPQESLPTPPFRHFVASPFRLPNLWKKWRRACCWWFESWCYYYRSTHQSSC